MPLPSYNKLLASFVPKVAEGKKSYQFLTERHIQALWFEQKYFEGLKTQDLEPIEIISPGIWNLEAGPDFRKAHIRVNQKDYYGDVEIHFTDESWQQHQHHLDARYDHVILHVSLWKPLQEITISTKKGTSIPKVHLESFLSVSIDSLTHLIDLDLYPYETFVGSGRCASELFNQLPPQDIRTFFEKAADWRLNKKRNFFIAQLEDVSLHFVAGIALALGYKNNSDPFLRLFLELQKRTLQTEEEKIAWLLGVSGFFAPYFREKWGKSPYYEALYALYISRFPDETFRVFLHLHQIRPLNHPVRRLVALAKMLSDPNIHDLQFKIFGDWNLQWPTCAATNKWKTLLEQFMHRTPDYKDTYWNTHYLFELEERDEYLTLMGNDLKREIVINLFLPLLENHIEAQEEPRVRQAFQQFYRWLPASKTGKRKYLIHRFFGDSLHGDVLNSAYTQQGAYQLHYDFCTHFESSCQGCPFVERYKQYS